MNVTKILAGLLLVLAMALAVGAWLLGRSNSRDAERAALTQATTTKREAVTLHAVVVTARPVAAGIRITPEDVKIAQLPAAVANSFAQTDAVVGHTTLVALPADAPVFEQHLLSGLALQLESGQRAVSIAVKEAMAAGHHVSPGDFVDVFFTLDGKSDQAAVDTQTRLLLARSRVLAYGAASVENPPVKNAEAEERGSSLRPGSNKAANNEPKGRNTQVNTAVLAVPLADVERLTLAEKYGQLTLALRHPDDTSVPDASLFAALPTALQPVSGKLKKGESLQGADRSFAGLRFKDLATGADKTNAHGARNARPSDAASAMRSAGVNRAPAGAAPARQSHAEVYLGGSRQVVGY